MRRALRYGSYGDPAKLPGCVCDLDALRIPQATYVSDTFTRADSASSLGSADSGQAYTVPTGTGGISSNKAYNVSATADFNAVVDAGVADCVIEVTLDTLGGDPGLYYRSDGTAANWIRAVAAGTTLVVTKCVSSVQTAILTVTSLTWNNGDILKVVVSGSVQAFYQNGTYRGTVTDSANASNTRHGIGAGTGNSSARWDNLTIRLPANGDPLKTWLDVSGFGNSASQTTPTKQPTYKANYVNGRAAVEWDGSNDSLKASFTLIQPCTVVLAVQVATWALNTYVCGGASAINTNDLYMSPTTPKVSLYAGVDLAGSTGPTVGAWAVVSYELNGSSSTIRLNGTQIASGNAGTGTPTGITLGSDANGNSNGNVRFTRALVYGKLLPAAQLNKIERSLGAAIGVAVN